MKMTKPNLNDQVYEIHLLLVETENYARYLYAVLDKEAVEGSVAFDRIMAATLSRAKAAELGRRDVAKAKLATIVKALNVVQLRYATRSGYGIRFAVKSPPAGD
jgi:hypothetical protein